MQFETGGGAVEPQHTTAHGQAPGKDTLLLSRALPSRYLDPRYWTPFKDTQIYMYIYVYVYRYEDMDKDADTYEYMDADVDADEYRCT